MQQAGERLQLMLKQIGQMHHDQMPPDPERARQVDQLHERLRNMVGEMEAAHQALRKIVGS